MRCLQFLCSSPNVDVFRFRAVESRAYDLEKLGHHLQDHQVHGQDDQYCNDYPDAHDYSVHEDKLCRLFRVPEFRMKFTLNGRSDKTKELVEGRTYMQNIKYTLP